MQHWKSFFYVCIFCVTSESLTSVCVFTHTQWSETVKVCSHAKVFFVESADWMKVKKPRNTVDGALIFLRIQNHNLFVFLYIYICWGGFPLQRLLCSDFTGLVPVCLNWDVWSTKSSRFDSHVVNVSKVVQSF